jgi:cellulose synthase operon protein C
VTSDVTGDELLQDDDGTRANVEMEAAEPGEDDDGDFGDASTVELGDAVMLAELDKFDKFEEAAKRSRRRFAAVVPRDATRTDARRTAPAAPRADVAEVDDADVYTSAARPGTSSEAVAQPQRPPGLGSAGGRNLSPAVSRPNLPGPSSSNVVRRRKPEESPSTGFDEQESTRIADFGELEPGMSASAISHPTPPQGVAQVIEVEDDYADIEIEGSSTTPAPEPARRAASEGERNSSSPALVLPPVPPAGPAAPTPARRTAHVLRRRGPTTKPPPMVEASVAEPRGPSAIKPVETRAPATDPTAARAAKAPGGEDDFSDLMGGDEAPSEGRPEKELRDLQNDRTPAPAPMPVPRQPPRVGPPSGPLPSISNPVAKPAGPSAPRPPSSRDATESDASVKDASLGDQRVVSPVSRNVVSPVSRNVVTPVPRNVVTPVPLTTVISPPPAGMSPDDEDGDEVTMMIGSETRADVTPAPASPFGEELAEPDDDFEDDDPENGLASGLGNVAIRSSTAVGGEDEPFDPPAGVVGQTVPGRLVTSAEEAEQATSVVIELRNKRPAPTPIPKSSGSPATPGSGARPLPATPSMVPSRVKTPTSVPAMGNASARRELLAARPPTSTELVFEDLAGAEPSINLDKISFPESLAPLASSGLDESFAQTLELIEEDLQTVDDREGAAVLRLEAGRLAEHLGEAERARGHYDAAVLADPRLGAALRGLRRIALASGDLSAATHQLDAELEVAGSLERRALGHYRTDLLMAAAEQDLARVAVGEMLDAAPSDVRALIAQLELAYLDGRYDELGASLAQLAHAVSDAGLRAAADTARAVLSTRPELRPAGGPGLGQLFLAAAADPSAMMARLSAARYLALENEPAAAAEAMTQVAFQIALADKDVAAALAVRSLLWGVPDGAVDLAATAAPADPIVAQTMVEAASPSDAAAALSRCADRAPSLARRSYLAGLAAEIDLDHASEHWAHVLAADPGDDYAAAQLRTSHVASDATGAAIEVDLAASQEENRERSRLRGGFGLAGLGQMDRAIEVLREGRRARPASLPIAEALAEVYAQGAMWRERAELFAELASGPGDIVDPELAAMRSALAWEDAATAASGDDATHARRQAVAAWLVVLEAAPSSPVALGALMALARSLEDAELQRSALARAHAVERIPWMSSSLALRRARHVELEAEGDSLLRDAQQLGVDDPRRLTMQAWTSARRGELDEIVTSYDDRARYLEELDPPRTVEAASLRLRAAQISVEANDPARAATLFASVGEALPTLSVVPDLLASARRRAGDQPVTAAAVRRVSPSSSSGDEFARWIREADYLAGQGDSAGAIGLYQRALDLHPHDPLAAEPLRRLATATGESAPISALALGRLRNAEASGEPSAIAEAYLVLADIDLNLRRDEGAALIALESAIKADPRRLAALRQLAQLYASRGQLGELLRIQRLQLEQVSSIPYDRSALLFDIASLAERDGRGDDEVAEALSAALDIEPRQRLGLFKLEALVRRKGASAQLAVLEEQISSYFDGDGRSVAAFLTRAGETLAEIGDIEGAIDRFKRAEQAFPGHIPALRGWRLAALKGQLWLDVAESASREAAATDEMPARGELYHLAGVALMDKAAMAERAMVPLQKALNAVPSHKDAFLRLRILLEEDARHEDLASLLQRRLDVENGVESKVELHRALADLHRNFLSDREIAKQHYRAILELRADDLRAYGALSDIAWELGEWADAAEALVARARLEREPAVLRTLYFRLGLIYADRLPDVPAALGWLQKALQYDPDDSDTLVRLADLAAGAGEWKLALGACDRLVKNETNPEQRVAHLHRVARIFVEGLNDRKRAERALNVALDGAPTNEAARHELVRFYRAANDSTSIRIHLTKVAGVMRSRIEANPRDAEAYQVLSRAMADRETAMSPGSLAVARIAAELAILTSADAGPGAVADLAPERRLISGEQTPRLAALLAADANDLLFPRAVQGELRQMFHLLGDRLAKHVGVDLRAYGTTRGERLRVKESSVARVAQEVATALGFGEIDVFIAPRMPWVYATEPTNPVSLILGKELAPGDETHDARVRFAAASALKLASCSLSIAARLPAEELGVLVVALLRLFTPEFAGGSVDQAQVTAQVQKLKRLIPTNLVNELRPYALSLDGSRLDPVALSTDLRAAGLRAGVVATQSILPALELIANGDDPASGLSHPMAADLLKFALGEDMVALSR